MICSVQTLGITGIQGNRVVAECYISNGLPGFDIVGLPDAAVKEARERVRAAAKNSGMTFPASRITVNLAPANLKKAGTHYDLPILLAIMAAAGGVRRPKSTSAFIGEVSLEGTLRPVSGVLPMALAAKRDGIETLFVPAERQEEVSRWNENWKEVRGLLRSLSELQRTELRVSLGQESAAATSVRDVVPQRLRKKRPRSRG